jgi:hypothetical protein
MLDWLFFIASSSALRATGVGASRISRGSYIAGVWRVNARKSTDRWDVPISAFSCVCQPAWVSHHPLFPSRNYVLLTYIHLDLSTTLCVCEAVAMCGGVVVCGICVGG